MPLPPTYKVITHLTEEEFNALVTLSADNYRSLDYQLRYFVRQALGMPTPLPIEEPQKKIPVKGGNADD